MNGPVVLRLIRLGQELCNGVSTASGNASVAKIEPRKDIAGKHHKLDRCLAQSVGGVG